ncbi:MAG: flagellar hook assembly protein FlgD [Spirochaetales bacterium]|nr:flagellar hook assembly protein FlgD [Spirochaetales bacterium]MCF7937610.1 flagellar hook assembly protein FlgD [Spirochaetales bacterium]
MDEMFMMNGAERAKLEAQVNNINASFKQNGRVAKQELGKDDFLKILLTQLTNQDPTKPMEDKEFISQMAQFSSLEQMNNISSNFEELAGMMASDRAIGLLNRTVDVSSGNRIISGIVEEVGTGKNPEIHVNGKRYGIDQVVRIRK